MDKVGFVDIVHARGGYLWDRNREEAIMGSGWGILRQERRSRRL